MSDPHSGDPTASSKGQCLPQGHSNCLKRSFLESAQELPLPFLKRSAVTRRIRSWGIYPAKYSNCHLRRSEGKGRERWLGSIKTPTVALQPAGTKQAEARKTEPNFRSHGSGPGFSLGREETLPGREAPKWPKVQVTTNSSNGRRYKLSSGEQL